MNDHLKKNVYKWNVSLSQFEKFVTTVNRNMVDSNMFIRSLVLSLEHFRSEGKDTGTVWTLSDPVLTYTHLSSTFFNSFHLKSK